MADTITVQTGSGSKVWAWTLGIIAAVLLIGGTVLFILWQKEKNRDKKGGIKKDPAEGGRKMGTGELGYTPKPDQGSVLGGSCGQGLGTWASDGAGGMYCMSVKRAPLAVS